MGKATQILFYVLLGIYIVLLLLNPQFAPAEEPTFFFETIQIGKYYPFYIDFTDARFQPLHSQEYNLVTRLLPATPLAYYIFNSLQLIIFFWLFSRVLTCASKNHTIVYFSLLFLLLSPGINNVWFRLIVGERGVVFFGALFLYLYLVYLRNYEKLNSKSLIIIIVIIICANLAIYYKEPVCLAIGSFSFLHLTLSWTKSNYKLKLLDSLLLLSSCIFLLVYFFIIYLNSTSINYAEGIGAKSLTGIIRNILAYVFSDPILIFCFLPFTAWRAYQVLIKKQTPHPVYDAMLGAALIYIAAIFKLNLQSSYYLLPAYIFAIPALLFFITRLQKRLMARRWWQVALGIAIFLQVTSAVPLGLETLSEYKYIPSNANLTMDFLVNDIKSKHPHQRANIFLDGINRNSNGYQYNDFGQYLKYKGLTIQDFDLKSNLPPDNQYPWEPVSNSPYSVFQSEKVVQILSGDYLILTPYSYKEVTDSYLNNMKMDYKLLFRTYSKWAIPNIGVERVIKYLLIKTLPKDNNKDMFRQGGKVFNPIVDYYVFMRK